MRQRPDTVPEGIVAAETRPAMVRLHNLAEGHLNATLIHDRFFMALVGDRSSPSGGLAVCSQRDKQQEDVCRRASRRQERVQSCLRTLAKPGQHQLHQHGRRIASPPPLIALQQKSGDATDGPSDELERLALGGGAVIRPHPSQISTAATKYAPTRTPPSPSSLQAPLDSPGP